jgi:hypothetical protein
VRVCFAIITPERRAAAAALLQRTNKEHNCKCQERCNWQRVCFVVESGQAAFMQKIRKAAVRALQNRSVSTPRDMGDGRSRYPDKDRRKIVA